MTISWEEQTSSTKFVVYDKYLEDYDKERQVLLKKGDAIVGQIESFFTNQFGNQAISLKIMDGDKITAEKVNMNIPTYLNTALGFNEEYPRERVAKVGDVVKIQYNGRDETKEKKPYMFKVFFGK